MTVKPAFAVLTISDSVSRNLKPDTSGDKIIELIEAAGFSIAVRDTVADEQNSIADRLRAWSDDPGIAGIITTGGTGVGPRDVTPEAALDVIEKTLPGMAEAMRWESLKKTPFAMLSRQVVGIRNQTLIVTLPGSPKAVQECLEVVLPMFPHVLNLIAGNTQHSSDNR